MNFEERFKGVPLKIGHLSRLVTASEAKAVKEGLTDGTTDIVVGTHALLAKGIEFKRLGLVIVDEEQRFGVTQQERLQQLKSDVHVLTLTATPDRTRVVSGKSESVRVYLGGRRTIQKKKTNKKKKT